MQGNTPRRLQRQTSRSTGGYPIAAGASFALEEGSHSKVNASGAVDPPSQQSLASRLESLAKKADQRDETIEIMNAQLKEVLELLKINAMVRRGSLGRHPYS
jgi:hypothetical protein